MVQLQVFLAFLYPPGNPCATSLWEAVPSPAPTPHPQEVLSPPPSTWGAELWLIYSSPGTPKGEIPRSEWTAALAQGRL